MSQLDLFNNNQDSLRFECSYEELLESVNDYNEVYYEDGDSELYSIDEGMLDDIDTPKHLVLEDNIIEEIKMNNHFDSEVNQNILKESVVEYLHSDTKIGVTSNISKTITEESISSDDCEYFSKDNPKNTKRDKRAQPKKVLKSRNWQEMKVKKFEKEWDVETLFSDSLYNHINECTISIPPDKSKRGRPKKKFVFNMEDLKLKIKAWAENLDSKIDSDLKYK